MPLAPATCPPGEEVADAAAAEAAALSTERLEAEITSLAGHIAAATCRFLLYVAEFDRREGWAAWECRSGAHWLMWHCGMNIRTAQDHLRVAHALEHLPQVRAHFAAGILSYSKVRAITRVADADGACHLQGSTNIAPETARRLACDATTHTIVTGPDGKATLVDKASKTIPPRVRREVDARDHGCCRIPGCGATGHTHAHHIVHRAHHGRNELDNLITLCPFHHRLVHEGGYRVELDHDQVILHRPGRPPLKNSPPRTPTGDPITTTNFDLGLHIEPTTIISRWDGTRLTNDDLSWSLAFLNAGLFTPCRR